jgi:UDP-2,3-diacylglucosamine hydrolase
VCLGDLFDVWVGRCQLALSGTAPVADALARLGAAGVAIDLLPGNRDSLLDAAFEQRAGVTLRRDGLVLTAADGRPSVLCLHGDELCIREPGYLKLRRCMRSRWFRALSRVAPLWFARAVGRRLRASYSGARGQRHPERGPQRDAAFAAAWGAGVPLLLSGHSHAPADDVLPSAGMLPVAGEAASVRWVTLGAFAEGADVVRLDAEGTPEVLSASADRP